MIDLDFLTGLGLDNDTAGALLELVGEEVTAATQAGEGKKLPRVVGSTPGGPGNEKEREQFATMGYLRRLKLKQENPQLYGELAEQSTN